jgi:Ca2+-binding EF-hand superfamily protein
MTDNMFNDLDLNKDERLTKAEIRPLFERQGADWGLPPIGDPETDELFNQVFKAVDTDKSGEVEKSEYEVLAKALFADFAEILRLNPILVDIESASR